jgi:hypothetical protein
MYQDDFNTAVVEEQKDRDGSFELPENVTAEPRNEEEAHLDKFKNDQAVIRTYLKVSDDYGELLGDKDLETEVIECCKQYMTVKPKDIKEPEAALQQLVDLSNRYVRQINKSENISIGITTKYRIREGMLFNIQKKIVKKVLELNWTEWFDENYNRSLLRSVQDYMRLAKVPKIIGYAVFGKEQLLEILRRIGKPQGKDPIGDFLSSNGIDYNPEMEFDVTELKIVTDIAIARQKLNSEDLEEVSDEKIEALIRSGLDLTTTHINQLKLVKSTQGNLGQYIDNLIATGGTVEPIQTPETKSRSFKKILDRFLDQTATALDDDQYLGEVDLELCRQLLEKIQQLQQKLTSSAN